MSVISRGGLYSMIVSFHGQILYGSRFSYTISCVLCQEAVCIILLFHFTVKHICCCFLWAPYFRKYVMLISMDPGLDTYFRECSH